MKTEEEDEAAYQALPYRPCVGLVILNRDNEIFAGVRIDHRGEAWQMPQGGIDPGESPLEAALRELGEETGIPRDRVILLAESSRWLNYDLPRQLVPKIWKGRFRGQTQRWFLFRYLGRDEDINIATEHPEFSAWSWLPQDRIIEKIVPFKRTTYREVFREFSDHLREI